MPSGLPRCKAQFASGDQISAYLHSEEIVKFEQGSRRATLCGQWGDDPVLVELKVIVPLLRAGIEELSDLAGLWIKRREISPFMTIAIQTSVGEIVQVCLTAVLPRNDMIDFMEGPASVLRKVTVLAPPSGALSDFGAQGC